MAENDQDQETEDQEDGGKEINDPSTRTDAEAPRAKFEGKEPKEG